MGRENTFFSLNCYNVYSLFNYYFSYMKRFIMRYFDINYFVNNKSIKSGLLARK